MKRAINNRDSLLVILVATSLLTACNSWEGMNELDTNSSWITFATTTDELSVTTKAAPCEVVSEESTDFGNFVVTATNRVAANTLSRVSGTSFASGEQLGLFLYYNYWFVAGAESVLYNNQLLESDGTTVVATSSDGSEVRKLWTFSSIGGNAPFHAEAIGYYLYEANVTLCESSQEGGATLNWGYNAAYDFMMATTDIDYEDDDMDATTVESEQGSRFKTYILETLNGCVNLDFEHKLATLSFYPYKASTVSEEIAIKSLTINYDAPSLFSYSTITNSESWTITQNHEETLNVVESSTSLTTTASELALSTNIYLPPATTINRITFDITVGTLEQTYVWHPHIVGMEAKEYQIQFELDPDRNN